MECENRDASEREVSESALAHCSHSPPSPSVAYMPISSVDKLRSLHSRVRRFRRPTEQSCLPVCLHLLSQINCREVRPAADVRVSYSLVNGGGFYP